MEKHSLGLADVAVRDREPSRWLLIDCRRCRIMYCRVAVVAYCHRRPILVLLLVHYTPQIMLIDSVVLPLLRQIVQRGLSFSLLFQSEHKFLSDILRVPTD